MNDTTAVLDRVEVWGEALAGKLEQLALDHGDKAVDLALNVARLDAASGLMFGVAALLTALAFFFAARFSIGRLAEDPDAVGWEMVTGISGAAMVLLMGVGLAHMLDLWRWAGVFWPELWLAKKVIGL